MLVGYLVVVRGREGVGDVPGGTSYSVRLFLDQGFPRAVRCGLMQVRVVCSAWADQRCASCLVDVPGRG